MSKLEHKPSKKAKPQSNIPGSSIKYLKENRQAQQKWAAEQHPGWAVSYREAMGFKR